MTKKIQNDECLYFNTENYDKIISLPDDAIYNIKKDYYMLGSLMDCVKHNQTMDDWLVDLRENYLDQYILDHTFLKDNRSSKEKSIDEDFIGTIPFLRFLMDKDKPLIKGIKMSECSKIVKGLQILFTLEYFVELGVTIKTGKYTEFDYEPRNQNVTYRTNPNIEFIEEK